MTYTVVVPIRSYAFLPGVFYENLLELRRFYINCLEGGLYEVLL